MDPLAPHCGDEMREDGQRKTYVNIKISFYLCLSILYYFTLVISCLNLPKI